MRCSRRPRASAMVRRARRTWGGSKTRSLSATTIASAVSSIHSGSVSCPSQSSIAGGRRASATKTFEEWSFLPVFTDSRLGLRRRRTGARSCAGRSETPTKARADPRRPRRTPRAAHRGRPLRDRPSRSVPSRGSADRLSPRTDERCCSWSATDDVAGAHLNLGELVACSVEGRTWHQARPVSKPVQRLRWCGRVWQRLLLSDVERPPTGKRAAPLPCRAACP